MCLDKGAESTIASCVGDSPSAPSHIIYMCSMSEQLIEGGKDNSNPATLKTKGLHGQGAEFFPGALIAAPAVLPALRSAVLALLTHRKELARWVGQFFFY